MCVPLGGEKGSPPLMAGGFVIDDRGYIGRKGIAPALFLASSASSSAVSLCTSVEEGLHLRPSSSHCLGGGGMGLPPHNVGKFHRGAVVTQLGRSGDTMICEKATFCTRVQVGTARDVLRHHAADVWSSRAMLGLGCLRSGRFRRCHPSGSVCTRRLGWALRAGEVLHLWAQRQDRQFRAVYKYSVAFL